MMLRVVEKHETLPFTQQRQRRSRPDGLASNDCVPNIAQFLIYVHGPRPVAHLLDVDADRVIESHCEHAAIAAVGDAELEIGTVCPRNQMRLAMMIACKGQCRRVCIAIDGKYLPHHPMRLDETHPI